MNRLLDFQLPKHSHGRMLGLFLLALPLSGIAFQPTAAHAQPVPALPAKKSLKPLSTEQKAAIAKVMVIARQENFCQSPIDLKVENATLEDVVARVKALSPRQEIPIEVRGATPIRVGFDLKNALAGNVLTNVAALAGCKLYLLSGGLLIAPSVQLTDAENAEVKQRQSGEWARSLSAGGNGWTNESMGRLLFVKAIAQEVTGSDANLLPATVVKTSFGDFSPDSQAMLQQMATWITDGNRRANPGAHSLRLRADTPIEIDTSDPKTIGIDFKQPTSNPGGVAISTTTMLR